MKQHTVGGFKATDEQSSIIEHIATGESLLVNAFAGGSKTSTLVASAANIRRKVGLYICYNKALQVEAEKDFRPAGNVECRTSHSLAYSRFGRQIKHRLNGRLTGRMVSEFLKLHDDNPSAPYSLTSTGKAYVIMAWINKLCATVDPEPSMATAPWGEITVTAGSTEEEFAIKREILEPILPYAKRFWLEWQRPASLLPATHDLYLRLWAMTNPKLDEYDFIMVDEFQDCNPLLLSVIENNMDKQVIGVGDEFQAIYQWRGAVDAMNSTSIQHKLPISQSFRYAQPVADVAMGILKANIDVDVTIRGFEGRNTRVITGANNEIAKCVISRTNAMVVNGVIQSLEAGLQVHVPKGIDDMIATVKGIGAIMAGKQSLSRDLRMFTSHAELAEYVESSSGGDMKVVYALTKQHGASVLVSALEGVKGVRASEADVIYVTAHSSKGLEFSSVKLAGDFKSRNDEGFQPSDANLLYVAATRAKSDFLDISDCHAALKSMGIKDGEVADDE